MIKLVIADDEYLVREGLRTIIDWGKLGIELMGLATDGCEAYDLCSKIKPDLLICDICMPGMNCFELTEALNESGNYPKIIIISGVQDFQYAKSAVSLNAYAYILKPVDIDELEKTVSKAVNDIRSELMNQETLMKAQAALQENRRMKVDEFVRSWLSGTYDEVDDLEARIRRMNLSISLNQWLRAAVLRPSTNPQQTLVSLRIQLEARNKAGLCTLFHNGTVGIITSLTAEETKVLLEEEHGTCGGIGRSVLRAAEIPTSFMQANRALEFSFFTGLNSVNCYSDVHRQLLVEDNERLKKEDELVEAITTGNLGKAETIVQHLLNYYVKTENKPQRVQMYALRILFLVEKAGVNLDNNFLLDNQYRKTVDCLLQCRQFGEIHELILDAVQKVTDSYYQVITTSKMSLSERVKEMIDKNYAQSLNVQSIADSLHFSRGYVSSCFRNDTGTSISDYIINTRMEHAKTLLISTNMKIMDIAIACGYEDANYFSRVFKRTQGMYPMQYRENTGF